MRSFAFTLLVFVCYFPSFAQSQQIDGVEITSSWGGLGDAQKSRMTTKRRNSDFISSGRKIDPIKIDTFLESLGQPTLSKPSLENLGVTPNWLLVNARKCLKECVNGYISLANPDQKELFVNSYTNREAVEAVISGLFRGGWTDDYPHIEINIRFDTGEKINLSSDSQALFMIPWKVDSGSGPRTTYDARISAALVSLLPPKFTNERRLKGEWLADNLAESLLRRVKPDWNRLEVLATLKTDVPFFTDNYEIVSMELNSNHDSDFGTPWDTKGPIEKNLHIVLRKSTFPDGFALKVILPVANNRVLNVDTFQQNIGRYLDLVDSVPWLKEYIATSGTSVWLRFVKNRSFSQKGMASFAADMKALGKENIAKKVEKVQDDVALISIGGGLEYYQSFWLILPDGTSVVWRHYRVSPLPNLKFSPKECSQNRSNTKPCVGELISRDGRAIAM